MTRTKQTRTSAKMLEEKAALLADVSGKKCTVVTAVRGCSVHFDGVRHDFTTFTAAWDWMDEVEQPYFKAWLAAI